MDVNSVEFYTIAFVVAMALVAFFMGRTEKKPPSTYIVQLETEPAQQEQDDTVTLENVDRGRVLLSREGLMLAPEETVNLVITIRDDQCSIIEKKGIKRRGQPGEPVSGQVSLKCLRIGNKYRVRYESQVTSTWATFTFDTQSLDAKQVTLKY